MIKDSGERRTYASGAVRDTAEGKGRCDLLPLDVVAKFLEDIIDDCNNPADVILKKISDYQQTGDVKILYDVLYFSSRFEEFEVSAFNMLLRVAKHFEEGCAKYTENNWRKGIPAKCYIDSAVRHLLKHLRGDEDEPHLVAFVWNIMCCIWTCVHKPELNDYMVTGNTTAAGDNPTSTEKYPVTKFLESISSSDKSCTCDEVDWGDVIKKMWEADVFYD